MQIYKAPLMDMKFLMKDFLNSGPSDVLFKNSEIEKSDLEMILDEAAKLCEEILLPINQSGDEEGCNFNNGKVTTPKGFKVLVNAANENCRRGSIVLYAARLENEYEVREDLTTRIEQYCQRVEIFDRETSECVCAVHNVYLSSSKPDVRSRQVQQLDLK